MRIVDIACGLTSVALLLPSQEAAAQFQVKKVLTLDIARKMVAAAESEAARLHLAGVVAVVDDGGWPILLKRMDNAAFVASVELAPGKARTAALFKKPSEALEDAINHGRIAEVTAARLHPDAGWSPNCGRWADDRWNRSKFRYTRARRSDRARRPCCIDQLERGILAWCGQRDPIAGARTTKKQKSHETFWIYHRERRFA
jgi:hypothetical protein